MNRSFGRTVLPLLALAFASLAHADDATVGGGTPASCTEATLDLALQQLVVGVQAPGGTLRFDCGSAAHTIAITTQKFLHGQIAIDGGGRITLDAQDLARHFHVAIDGQDGRTEVTLRNLTLARGFAAGDYGGAIVARSGVRLDLSNVAIRDSRAGLSGGAIAIEPGGTHLNIEASLFTQNRATDGGAIATSASTAIVGSRFFGNSADVDQGGAIQSYVEDLVVDDSIFGSNSAARGGAIYKRGAQFTLQASRLQDNLARGDGGALYVESGVERFNVVLSNLDRNIAVQRGGAILAERELQVSATGFDANRASSGGAIQLLDSVFAGISYSSFSYNDASRAGGAIAASAVTMPPGNPPVLLISDSTLAYNQASGIGAIGGDVFSSAGSGLVTSIYGSTLMGASATNGGWSLHVGNGNVLLLAANLIWTPGGNGCLAEGTATITSGGFNLGPTAACQLDQASDGSVLMFQDFGLEDFADYGGPLRTFLPRADSLAVDARPCEGLDQIDMRLRPRGVDGNGDGVTACDSGAVERQRSEVPGSLFRDGFEDLVLPGGS